MTTDKAAEGQHFAEQPEISNSEILNNQPVQQWQKYLCAIIVYFTLFFGSVYIAFQGPIYPQEAVKKGLSPTQYSLVFGLYELTCFCSSPVIGKYIGKIGPTFLFKVGSAVMAVFTILFGLVNQFPAGNIFFGVSILFRVVRALSDVAAYTAGWVLIMGIFPETVATSMAILNMIDVLGITCGPLIGTSLYKINGFSLPYSVIGGLSALMFILSVLFIKAQIIKKVQEDGERPSFLKALKNPNVLLSMFSLFAVLTTNGCVLALLETHLRPLHLSELILGVTFTTFSGTNAVSSLIFGKIADKIGRFRLMCAFGLITTALSSLFLGPAPFIPIKLTLPLVFVCVAVLGTGIGCVVVNGLMGLRSAV
ncbi:hypothetical protein CHUAL_002268 [Chamberlinius hualienensis]